MPRFRRRSTSPSKGFSEALALAVHQLRHRDRFIAEVADALEERGFGEHRQEVIDRLVAKGVLHDGRVANAFAEQAWRKKGWSPTRVREALSGRGAPEDAIEDALNALPDESECVRTVLREGISAGDPIARIVRRLLSRGFDGSCVQDALESEGLGGGGNE